MLMNNNRFQLEDFAGFLVSLLLPLTVIDVGQQGMLNVMVSRHPFNNSKLQYLKILLMFRYNLAEKFLW